MREDGEEERRRRKNDQARRRKAEIEIEREMDRVRSDPWGGYERKSRSGGSGSGGRFGSTYLHGSSGYYG